MTAPCGTYEGYLAHRDAGEVACEPCWAERVRLAEEMRTATRRARGSRRRAQILEFVAAYWTANDLAPTLREVANGCGYRSPASVKYQVEILAEQGLVRYLPRSPRSLRVVKQ